MPRKQLSKQKSFEFQMDSPGSGRRTRDSVVVNLNTARVVIGEHEKPNLQNNLFEELSQLNPVDVVVDGKLKDLKMLVDEFNLNLHGRLADGATLLHLAVEKNQLETAEYLMDRGIDVNAVNCKGSRD